MHLHAYDSVSAARAGIAHYIAFYSTRRPQVALDERVPLSAVRALLAACLSADNGRVRENGFTR